MHRIMVRGWSPAGGRGMNTLPAFVGIRSAFCSPPPLQPLLNLGSHNSYYNEKNAERYEYQADWVQLLPP